MVPWQPGDDILDDEHRNNRPKYRNVEAVVGLVVEDRFGGFVGDVVKTNSEGVTLRDRADRLRVFTWKEGGFLLDGEAITLVRPTVHVTHVPRVSNAGGLLSRDASTTARVAQPHRIWVEGVHDADLLEHVWGSELRELGIVVEPMHGADDLLDAVTEFGPSPHRKLGVLLDHLVEGSKESRLAASITNRSVLITGHPYVDVWAGIRPRTIGIERWPDVPMGQPWKAGVCAALGVDLEGFWPRLRNAVSTFADLEPELVGAVERLIDFVAVDAS